MTNSKQITKHLRKLSKTNTQLPIDLNEAKIYWANRLVEQLKKEKTQLKKLHYEKTIDIINDCNSFLRNN
tara:strand:+ start:13155 stop:13364 length:210 start_codon:yes stop_codon:yes gene_type:complete